MKPFVKIPFLRLILPFILGIVYELYFVSQPVALVWLSLLLIAILALTLLPLSTNLVKAGIIVLADVFLFSFGINLTRQNNLYYQPDYYGNTLNTDSAAYCLATVNDLPVEKEKFIKCELKLSAIKKSNNYIKTRGTVFAYFRKDSLARQLQAGHMLLLKTRFLEVQPPKNPGEFDYKNYLYNRQVYHTAFVDSGSYRITETESDVNQIKMLGLQAKAYLLTSLKNSALNKDSYSICAALLTGYDDEVNQSVMEAFSHTGTLHVLSVSGLHTGLIYLVLNYIFNLVDRKRRYKLARFIFVTLVLWFFALVTGFSAPVLRAVIMFNLFGLGKIYFRNDFRNQLNILLVSAFILLLYNPFFITEIGFLLSYTALAGIIYFQPRFAVIWQPTSYLLKYAWQSVTASFAATLGTLPITLFCFKQFPIWFFVCNLLVVPLTFALLLLAFLVVLKLGFVAHVINWLVTFLIYFMNLFNAKGPGYIDTIDFTLQDFVFLSCLIIFISLFFETRRYRLAFMCFLLLICWQGASIMLSHEAKNLSRFTVYSIKNKEAFALKNKTRVYLAMQDTTVYNYHIKPQLISFNYPQLITGPYNYVDSEVQKVLILDKPGQVPERDIKDITVLVLANNYKLNNTQLEGFLALKTIVADASNNTYTLRNTEELCRKFDVDFYNARTKGAFIMSLP